MESLTADNRSLDSLPDDDTLREMLVASLCAQGYSVEDGRIYPPACLSKEQIRQLHEIAVKHRIDRARKGLFSKEEKLLDRIASGHEIQPSKIRPVLVEVLPRSEEELLFRYASLHWSIPVSSGYGRRLRFLVIDENNKKLMGLIGLGDPVFSLAPRDEWVGWTHSDRRDRLSCVMDAFVLGAVPPYSFLLCGKLVALLVASDTVRRAYKRKYGGTKSIISQKEHRSQLAMITTISALGRSSIYNRLRMGERLVYERTGFTKGYGEFHFTNGLYSLLSAFADARCKPTAKQQDWGTGFRNRREVVRKSLVELGLSSKWNHHGIEREVFVVPLAHNTRDYLRGRDSRLKPHVLSEEAIYEHFARRWMRPRLEWDSRFEDWSKQEWALWMNSSNG